MKQKNQLYDTDGTWQGFFLDEATGRAWLAKAGERAAGWTLSDQRPSRPLPDAPVGVSVDDPDEVAGVLTRSADASLDAALAAVKDES